MQAARTEADNSVRDVDNIERRCYLRSQMLRLLCEVTSCLLFPRGFLWSLGCHRTTSESNPACIPFTDTHSNGRSDARPRWQRKSSKATCDTEQRQVHSSGVLLSL